MSSWRLLLTRPAEESAALATVLADAGSSVAVYLCLKPSRYP